MEKYLGSFAQGQLFALLLLDNFSLSSRIEERALQKLNMSLSMRNGDMMKALKIPFKVIAAILVGLGIVLPLSLGVLVPYGIVVQLLGQ